MNLVFTIPYESSATPPAVPRTPAMVGIGDDSGAGEAARVVFWEDDAVCVAVADSVAECVEAVVGVGLGLRSEGSAEALCEALAVSVGTGLSEAKAVHVGSGLSEANAVAVSVGTALIDG